MAEEARKSTDNLVVGVALCVIGLAIATSLLSGVAQIIAMVACGVALLVSVALIGARMRSRKR